MAQVPARDGQQESARRAGRCGPGDRGQRRGAGRVLFDRPALHGVVAAHRHRRHSRPVRRGADARSWRRCGSTTRSRREPRSARSSSSRSSSRTSNTSRVGQREGARLATAASALQARNRRLLHGAGALRRRDQRDADLARRDLRAGRVRDPRARLRRSARDCQRHRDRPVVRDRDDVAEARVALQAPCAGRDGDGEPADRRRRLSRAVRRPQRRRATARASRAGTRPSSTRRSRPPTSRRSSAAPGT